MRDSRPGRTLRLVLLFSFGGLLALLLFAGLDALSVLQRVHASEEQARSAFLARNASLVAFRSYLDVYGDHVQQYFLASGAASDFPQMSRQIAAALDSYPADRQPEESALLAALHAMLIEQQQAVDNGRSTDHRNGRYLCEQVLPGRARLLEATGQIVTLNHEQFQGADAALVAEFSTVRAHLTRLLIIVLGSGLILAIGSIVYIAGQDRESRQRYTEVAQSRADLAQLSARLLNAQEEERRSFSRELHDEVGQSLGALLVDIGRLATLVSPADVQLQEELSKIKSATERTVGSVRNISLLLRPSMLDDLGLIPALEWQAREVSRRSDLEVEIVSEGVSENLPDSFRICIYRLTQETLNNAVRHSGGHHVWITVQQSAAEIAVTIRDDGRGFDPQRARGLGLLGMEERVRHLNGTLHVASLSGQGTTVTASLPYERTAG